MTAEVGILNRIGVVLAADSASTISIAGKSKIIMTDKLFSLSDHHPVGIMIYENAHFTSIPWETVIKIYSSYIGNKSFYTLQEYSHDFLNFLVKDKRIYDSNYEKKLVESVLDYCLMKIGIEYKTRQQQAKTISTKIENLIKGFSQEKFLNGFDESFIQLFIGSHKQSLKIYMNEIVNISIDNETQENIILLCAYIISKSNYLYNKKPSSGIVIAGYGTNEIFPSIAEYKITGIISGKLIYELKSMQNVVDSSTNPKNTFSTIMAFAQKDVVETYTLGIDPDIEAKIFEKINSIFNNFFDVIQSESNNSLPYEFSNQYRDKINEVGKNLKKQIEDTFTNIQKNKYIDPFATMAGFLGKEEMSVLAEALVNLTSTRRRFTTDDETVGGATDVAIITKGDGFKWIKRKY